MKMYSIKCTPGYPVSGGSGAFTAVRKAFMGVNQIQREWLGRAAAVAHVQTVITDVPGSMSALSLVRRT